MEKCFECYAENGLTGTGIQALADACGCTKANLYTYFKNLDELIIESTAYCMAKVEGDFMEKAPTDPKDVMRFIEEVPYWTEARQKISVDVSDIYPSKIYRIRQEIFRGRKRALYPVCKAAGAEDRNSVYDYHAVDFYIRAGLRTLCHV